MAEFAREHDSYINKYGVPSVTPNGGAGFSIYIAYVRGVAAHYGNDPQTLDTLLTKVAENADPQPGEAPENRDKRRVVAYYFLGLSESNFANYEKAIEHFQHAIDLERTPKDVLSRLVAAEAAAIGNRVVEAQTYLDQVDEILKDIKGQYVNAKKQVPSAFRKLGYRAMLIRANIAIARGNDGWSEAIDMLRTIKDPHEYYSTATLAQLLISRDSASAEARNIFREAYMSIRDLGHLHSVSEVRSKILLLLVAGLCAQYSEGYTGMMEEHFAEAEGLLGSLPKRGQQTCSVFSPISKRNETSSVIISHIESVRRGVLLSS